MIRRLFSASLCLLLPLGAFVGCAPKTADITVMSWNILNPSWGGTPASVRIDNIFDTLAAEMPDVVGLQEASALWHKEFENLPAPYAALCDTSNGDGDCMTMFLYNTDTLTLVESGIEDLDERSDIRVVSWAVFEVVGTKASFLITNTHPDSREAQCLAHTEHYLDIATRLYEEHGLPMISVGDFNATETSDAYQLSLDAGYTDSKYAEGVERINDIDSYLFGDFGGIVTKGQGSRDHIFYKDAVTPLTFETVSDKTTQTASDHLPVKATLTIG